MVEKYAVIFFHKNIYNIYKSHWIRKCIESILNQTFKADIFELDYGGTNTSVFDMIPCQSLSGRYYEYHSVDLPDNTYAMNYLITHIFEKEEYQIIFNTNLDDYYHPLRFEKQINSMKKFFNAEIISSYSCYIKDTDPTNTGSNDVIIKYMDHTYFGELTAEKIKEEIEKDHNVINHPGVAICRKLWDSRDKYENLIRYRNDRPQEDLTLWQRILTNKRLKIEVVPEVLVYYRIHDNQIGATVPPKKIIKYQNRIGLLFVATGKYTQFLPNVIISAHNNFVNDPNVKRLYYIFADQTDLNILFPTDFWNTIDKNDIIITPIRHHGFPGDTLYRYHYFLMQRDHLIQNTDIVYYLDVDMRVESPIELSEIQPRADMHNLVMVDNPGFYHLEHPFPNAWGDVEIKSKSTACVHPARKDDIDGRRSGYVAGGFNGGLTHYFLKMADILSKNIDIDDACEIIAKNHDESHLNWFYYNLYRYRKFSIRLLPPDYCYPELWKYRQKDDKPWSEQMPYKPKIVALDKDHRDVRIEPLKIKYVTIDFVGGLGNKLFQFAALWAYSKQSGFKMVLPNQTTETDRISYRHSIFRDVLRMDIQSVQWNIIKERGFSYEALTTNDTNNTNDIKNIMLKGYFQSYKYFDEYRQEICDFLLSNKIFDEAKNIYQGIENLFTLETVAIHVRRGDYLEKKDYHYNLSNNYYSKAIGHFNILKSTFVIFSDDITWCKQQSIFRDLPHVYFVDIIKDDLSLVLMSLCRHQIIANSSFSWWAAYLNQNKNKKVICPLDWFSVNGPEFKHTDLLINNSRWIDDIQLF